MNQGEIMSSISREIKSSNGDHSYKHQHTIRTLYHNPDVTLTQIMSLTLTLIPRHEHAGVIRLLYVWYSNTQELSHTWNPNHGPILETLTQSFCFEGTISKPDSTPEIRQKSSLNYTVRHWRSFKTDYWRKEPPSSINQMKIVLEATAIARSGN